MQPTRAQRKAPAAILTGQNTHAVTTKFRPIALQEIITIRRAFLAAANISYIIGIHRGGTIVEANLPATSLLVVHSSIEVSLENIVGAHAAHVARTASWMGSFITVLQNIQVLAGAIKQATVILSTKKGTKEIVELRLVSVNTSENRVMVCSNISLQVISLTQSECCCRSQFVWKYDTHTALLRQLHYY